MQKSAYVPALCEKICPMCSKRFYPMAVDEWVYKRPKKYNSKTGAGGYMHFCSWSCLKKYDKQDEEERLKSGKRKRNRIH